MSLPFDFSVPLETEPPIKRRYSLTTDIVAYRRCPKQYGTFNVHNYAPAHQTQLYFGTIVHQVLDRCHTHYHGLIDPSTQGLLPDNGAILSDQDILAYFDEVRLAQTTGENVPEPPSDIVKYFLEVENGLKSRGIRAITPDLRLKAIRILQYFNALEGPELYPRVIDTEHRLQADRGNHILYGVVDLLVNLGGLPDDPGECEIWDYKGTDPLKLTARDLETYRFQMQVYARLYELKHGVRPKQAILYFLNELDGPDCPETRPINAIRSVELDTSGIDSAITAFTQTVEKIEQARELDTWPAADVGAISDNDCTICDLRWDCPTPNNGQGVPMRYP